MATVSWATSFGGTSSSDSEGESGAEGSGSGGEGARSPEGVAQGRAAATQTTLE